MFAQLKERLKEKVSELTEKAAPQDALDKQAAALLEKATSDTLIAPDWQTNMEVVDMINSDPGLLSDKVLKAAKRCLVRQTAKKQLLVLTLLETCVKNCHPLFHVHLAGSEIWQEMQRMCFDTSITRVDVEVRDKILTLIEDCGKNLQPKEFKEAYEDLVDRGVDFPVRAVDDNVPFLTPPAAIMAATPVNEAPVPPEAQPAAAAQDPLAGVSDEDRKAIEEAMQAFAAEDREAQNAARVAAEEAAHEEAALRQQQQQQQTQQEQEAQAVAAGAAAHAAPHAGALHPESGEHHSPGMPPPVSVTPRRRRSSSDVNLADPAQVQNLLETVSNGVMVLSEALSTVDEAEPLPVREPFVAELADTCMHMRTKLERVINNATDEAVLASAISQHEELNAVLTRYQELLDKAEAVMPSRPAVQVPLPSDAHGAAGLNGGVVRRHSIPLEPIAESPQTSAPASTSTAAVAAAELAAAIKSKVTGAFDKLAVKLRSSGHSAGSAGAATGAGAYSPLPAAPASAPATMPGFGASGGDAALLPAATTEGHFTLLDDDDTEESSLLSNRAAAAAAGAVGAGDAAAAAQVAPAVSLLPPPLPPADTGPDLIAFDSDPDEPDAAAADACADAPAPAVAAAHAGADADALGFTEAGAVANDGGFVVEEEGAAEPMPAAAPAEPLPASSFPEEPLMSSPAMASALEQHGQQQQQQDLLVDALDGLAMQDAISSPPQ